MAVVALVLGSTGSWHWWNVLRFRQSTDDAYIQSDVSVISPKIEGYIKKVRVADNQEVAEGAILFVIDDRDFKAKVAQAEAAVATGEAIIATYESRLKLQQAMIDQAAAGLKSTEADLSRAQQDYERFCQPAAFRAGRSRRPEGRGGARQEPRRARRRAAPARRAPLPTARRRGQAPAGPRQSAAGGNRSRQHGHPRADIGDRRQSRRPGRPVRQAWDPAVVASAVAAGLRHGQFQGDTADPNAAGAGRRGVGRRLPGYDARGAGRELRPCQRRPVQPVAARQRNREFHQDRPARSGADCSPGEWPARRAAAPRSFRHGDRRDPRGR